MARPKRRPAPTAHALRLALQAQGYHLRVHQWQARLSVSTYTAGAQEVMLWVEYGDDAHMQEQGCALVVEGRYGTSDVIALAALAEGPAVAARRAQR